MNHRSGRILLACFLALACSQREDSAAPPQMPDRLAELRRFDPSSPDVRPNPPIDPSLLGCYAVELDPSHDRLSPPRVLELTDRPAGALGLHQLYAVRVDGRESKNWTWRMYTAGEIRVNLGNSFSGWGMTLRTVPDGLDGDAFRVADTMKRDEAVVRMRRTPCP